MSRATAGATREHTEQAHLVEAAARALAAGQREIVRSTRSSMHFFASSPVSRPLERAQKLLGADSAGDTRLPSAAEWFLDNYYLIRRVARQVEEELPRGFIRHLPQLAAGPAAGRLRIEALAQALVANSNTILDGSALQRFIVAYQELSPLTIAELWALPTMLRAAVLRQLLSFLDELGVPFDEHERQSFQPPPSADGPAAVASLDPGVGVERSVRELRVLDTIDWRAFFDECNRVEAILRTDPAQVYALMDFETCDSYRKVVESLAWATGTTEEDVASLAITLAHEGAAGQREGLVGYYLVAEGRRELERRLGYRPLGLDRIRRAVTAWPTLSYLLPLALLTSVPLLAAAAWVAQTARPGGAPLLLLAVAVVVAVVPTSAMAVAALQTAFAWLLPPRTLPKLDFSEGLPRSARTLVVIPTLLGRANDVAAMMRQVELHYLSNPDPQLQFALLTDDVDATTRPGRPDAGSLLESVARGIASLNAKHGEDGHGPFHLLHREPHWNEAEERFMGWERKRGKLEELNRLLRGDTRTSYSRHIGDPEGLLGIRFVITLDSDTELPMGSAQRLVGLLAHPLNHAVFDASTGRVIRGYTIVQPRIETSPSSARQTFFSRIFAGDIGFDIYTHACSELYQDLFGSGIYVGKGIYDVDAFVRSVEGRAPENALVSHDLFEGVHGRTALATDIVLFESYPASYATYAMRMHRWVRGDWQLLPWLLTRVPSARGARLWNKLDRIDRWKIADNLRRSLTGPAVVVLLVLGWIWLPGSVLAWTLGALALLVAPFLPALVGSRRMHAENLGRCALALVFLVYEAAVVLDAVVRVLVRKTITRKHLLQWTSAAHTAFGIAARPPRAMFWRMMIASPLLAVALAVVVAWARPSALVVAAPLLVAWFIAPEIARWISRDLHARTEHITPSERKKLRRLARRTWRFFDAFIGPNDQWLPVDNYQAEPHEQTAHRTSPTNMGLALASTLCAYDLGYIGPSELSLRVRRAFESMARMQHYEGHLFNWYDTKNLQPLLPRYVSTVDSGNLAGCLLALAQGCKEVMAAPIVRAQSWDGLRDSVDLLEEVVESVPNGVMGSLRSIIARMQHATSLAHDDLPEAHATLRVLCDETFGELEHELLSVLEAGAQRYEGDLLHELRMSIDALHQLLEQMRRELDALLPWLALRSEATDHAIDLPMNLRLDEIPAVAQRLLGELDASRRDRLERGGASVELDASAQRLDDAFRRAAVNASALLAELLALATCADDEVRGMNFKLLYDTDRKLFNIGYNATIDQVDTHHYDLLASEARLASYIAIVKRDVPESHWYALGRQMTLVAGTPALLSWGGTMFEYLMPSLLMMSQRGTLIARTVALVVDAQIAYGKRNGEPWGISESAYARVDAAHTYQYRSFGVPGLGLKRGLEDDRVVSPHASILAVGIRPRAVVDNLAALEAMGMLGVYGFFEALDFTPERALSSSSCGQPCSVVRSYMAHHQGMVLLALGNFLNGRTMVDRFHANAMIEAGEILLNEQAPIAARTEWPIAEGTSLEAAVRESPIPSAPAPWCSADQAGPQAFVLSNGSLTSVLTGSGGGGLRWRGLALTRYEPDATRDDDGVWLYLRDEHSRRVWLATSAAGRTTYAMHKVVFHSRNEGISVHVEVAVAAADDVEVRQITLHNETDERRQLTVTSAGRPILFDAKRAPTHPAFVGMFVESEWVAELEALVLARRPQTPDEEPAVLVHRLVREGPAVGLAGYESDRCAFMGRGASREAPRSLLAEGGGLGGRVGAVLDPIMSVMARIELEPRSSVTLAFVTTIGRSRTAALELAKKYASMDAVRWAVVDAEQDSPRRLRRTKVEPGLLPSVQRLFSALHFAEASLRAPLGTRVAAPPRQVLLWGRGISGDDPIMLMRVHDPDAPILRETLAAQRYLRACGVHLDLVLVDEQVSGYVTEGLGTIRAVLGECEASEWINRHGGVFVIASDQVPADELRHIEACARVVLDTRDGSLGSRLDRAVERPPMLPRFEPTLAGGVEGPPGPRPTLVFDNGTGGFSVDGREYVLEVGPGVVPPAPWCNVLANPEFGCLVSESSLGMTWSQNSGENRLTPWRNDPVLDTPSEALYLRDEETAEVWSPTPLPAGIGGLTRVRHGAGYSTYERESHGLVQELTIFVPCDASLKVVRLRLKNTLARHRRLTATYYAEWVLGSRREVQRPYIVSELERGHACLLASCSWSAEFGGRVAFLAAKGQVHGFTTDRTEFLGRRGDYAQPAALERWGLSGGLERGTDPCAALQVHLDLAAGEEIETHFVLGQSASRDEALGLVARFRDQAVVEAAWSALQVFWDDVLGGVRVQTPEPSMDLMVNRWLLYQTLSARVFARTGFYQSSGAFGYRDQLQDVLALLHTAPAIARAHLLEAARHQFQEGDVLHWWHPPSGRGVRTRCSDDMAWLPYVTGEYVAATGDTAVLDEVVPFLEGKPLRPDEHDRYAQYEPSRSSSTLLEHCRRAMERAVTEGVHGLPLMGDGDWNDGMNRVGSEGRGESVWLAWFSCAAMDRLAALLLRSRCATEASRWHARADSLRARIEAVAWDGEWYLRAFHDDGSRVGSAKSSECRIDSIAQSWAVLSAARGGGHQARAKQAVRAAHEQLVRDADRLVLLFWPPFDSMLHDPGYVRAYPPGIRENGGQYTHAAAWLGLAHAELGDGAGAERIFALLNPILRSSTAIDAARYRVEPYVIAGDIYSCPPSIGRGGWTWYTGSAAWMWRLGVEAILGLQRRDGRLRIDPCIPPAWPGFEAWVRLGKKQVHIVVENSGHAAPGVARVRMTLDGEDLDSNEIHVDQTTTGTHEVHVRLGPSGDVHGAAVHGAAVHGAADARDRREGLSPGAGLR